MDADTLQVLTYLAAIPGFALGFGAGYWWRSNNLPFPAALRTEPKGDDTHLHTFDHMDEQGWRCGGLLESGEVCNAVKPRRA